MSSQNLLGKWIELKDTITNTIPSINVLEFKQNKLVQYEFDKPLISATYNVVGNEVNSNGASKIFKFLENNILSLQGKTNYNGNDSIYSEMYLRIHKTLLVVPIEQVYGNYYEFYWGNRKNFVILNNLNEKSDFKLSRYRYCEDLRLEEIESMFFISVFCYGKREYVFPIKEINYKELTVYSFGNNEIKLKMIN